MPYRFYTADVFTERAFGGNPLAVFPQANGLKTEQMHQIAAEFNLSETVFVFPPETPEGTKRLRIFTPATELPFAGHPTVGTAYILASIGDITFNSSEITVIFEEGVGNIPVKIRSENGKPIYTELSAAKLPEFRDDVPALEDLAEMLSLTSSDLLNEAMFPQAVSCGVPFLFIPVRSREALGRAKIRQEHWQSLLSDAWAAAVYVFCHEPELDGSQWRSRMFAPKMGIEEDPATGAAATAFAGYLGIRETMKTGTLHWVIEQGFEMGRPSLLTVEADKKAGNITAIRVGGASVLMSEGTLYLS